MNETYKTAIITYHRSVNYGSALQSYSLNAFLNMRGFNAYTLDYWPIAYKALYKQPFVQYHGKFGFAKTFLSLANKRRNASKIKKFKDFIDTRLKITRRLSEQDLYTMIDCYDFYIAGSDQVWNSKCFEFTPVYYLDFVKDKKKCLSYAASTSVANINESPLFKEKIENFKAISLREPDAAKKASEVLRRNDVKVCCDPVFLVDKEKWLSLASESNLKIEPGKYVFAYFIGDYPGMRKLGRTIAKLYKVPLIVCNFNIRDYLIKTKKFYDAGPIDFLYLIANAKAVIADSFHACAFSAIFKKPFIVYGQNKVSNRTNNLLNLLDEPWHSVGAESLSFTNEELERHLEIKGPHPKLEKLIAESKDYLARALKND